MHSIRGRISYHRGEGGFGSKFIAKHRAAPEFANRRPLLNEANFEAQQDARFDRRAEFCAVDRHKVNELTGAGEAKRLYCENSRRLRQRLDDEDAGHDWTAGKVSGKKWFVDRDSLDRDDAVVDNKVFDTVNK